MTMGISNHLLTQSIRAPWAKRIGQFVVENYDRARFAWDNGFMATALDGNNNAMDLIGTQGSAVIVAGGKRTQRTIPVPVVMKAPATQVVFVVPSAMNGARLTGIKEIHATAETTTTDLTGQLVLDRTSGTAPGTGTSLLTSGFTLTATANTAQDGTLIANESLLRMRTGDRLTFSLSGSVNELAGLVATMFFSFAGTGCPVVIHLPVNGDAADRAIFIANGPRTVASIDYVHSTAGTDAGSVNVQVTKDTGTNAPGAGTNLLTNNSNAGFNCKGSINVVQNGSLTATAASLRMAAGDRLSVDFAGTVTALAGVVMVAWVTSGEDANVDVTYQEAANGDLVDAVFCLLDRTVEVESCREVHSTAGTNGAAVNVQLVLDQLTQAPGAGGDVLTNNSNAGFNCKGTANTVQEGTLVSLGSRIGLANDRLSLDYAGVLTALAGVVATASLRAR